MRPAVAKVEVQKKKAEAATKLQDKYEKALSTLHTKVPQFIDKAQLLYNDAKAEAARQAENMKVAQTEAALSKTALIAAQAVETTNAELLKLALEAHTQQS